MRLVPRLLTTVAVLAAASTAAAAASVIFVNAAAAGANNGSSWPNAYTDLQAALTTAGSGDEIWVAAETYRPAASDRTVSFALKNGVGVYGGFIGTETLRTQRNPATHVTILSGDIGTEGTSNDNSFHVVTAGATVTTSGTLDGFTITGGQADGANPNERGAGVWDNGGSPTLAHLILIGNFALSEGGGMRVTGGAPTILNCSFLANSVAFSGSGAGLKASGASAVYAQSCVFRSNIISGASVGGAGLDTSGNTTLVNCVFAQNNPSGAHFTGDGNTIDDCTFASNIAYGAAFFVSNANAINNSIFWGNAVDQIFRDGSSSATAAYCDVQDGYAGTGNISFDPLFLATPADLRLGPASPAVDAGKNSIVPGGIVVDVAGLPRFFDDPTVPETGVGIPPLVDMGAYERIPLTVSNPSNQTVCAGDSASFSVSGAGQAPLSFRWRKNGVNLSDGGPISGSATTTLAINPAAAGDAANYDVVVTDGFSQTLASGAATLAVNAIPTAAASGTTTICSGLSTPLMGSGGVSCSWLPTTGLSDPNSCTPSATPAGTTLYTLSVVAANGCVSTNDPSVTVTVNPTPTLPSIAAPASVPIGASGASASVPNQTGSTYAWTLTGGVITAGQTTNQIAFDAGAAGTTMHCTVLETRNACASPLGETYIQVDYSDMPPTSQFHTAVVAIGRNRITTGCGGGLYCGTQNIPRSQMAVFLLKAKYGASHVPPPATGTVFGDVHVGDFGAAWIEELHSLGVTNGCNGGSDYCPDAPVSRAEMAVFLLKTLNGSSYTPPAPTGIFADAPLGSFAVQWIEDLYHRGVTSGCNTNPLVFCPGSPNNRQEMAVFIKRTFNLQ